MHWNIQSRPTPTLYQHAKGRTLKFFSAVRSSLSVIGSVLRSPVIAAGNFALALNSSLSVVASRLGVPIALIGSYSDASLFSRLSVIASVLYAPVKNAGAFVWMLNSRLSLTGSALRIALFFIGSYTTPHVNSSLSLVSSNLV